jgi:hypothetical protein
MKKWQLERVYEFILWAYLQERRHKRWLLNVLHSVFPESTLTHLICCCEKKITVRKSNPNEETQSVFVKKRFFGQKTEAFPKALIAISFKTNEWPTKRGNYFQPPNPHLQRCTLVPVQSASPRGHSHMRFGRCSCSVGLAGMRACLGPKWTSTHSTQWSNDKSDPIRVNKLSASLSLSSHARVSLFAVLRFFSPLSAVSWITCESLCVRVNPGA